MIENLLFNLYTTATACVATVNDFVKQGDPGEQEVVSDAVPANKAWLIRGAGVFGDNPTPLEYMLQIDFPAGDGFDKIPIARSSGAVHGSPFLPIGYPLVLWPGERLSALVNLLPAGRVIGLAFTYYEIPRDCIPMVTT